MEINWKTGRPDCDGDYVVIVDNGFVMQTHFTTEHGWNTTHTYWDSAFPDEDVKLWTELFAKKAIDIYLLP